MSDSYQYWKDVYQNKFTFASKKNGAIIPWDIKTVDANLKDLIQEFNFNAGNLLEIGCGTGYDSNYLQKKGFEVTAIDISDEAIQIAKQINNQVTFVVDNFFTYQPSKAFDYIYDRGFLHNYKNNLLEIFNKLDQFTSKTGKLIIITGNPNQPLIETCMPPPIFLGEIEHYSSSWFKVIYTKEITFQVDSNYEECLGYIFLLEKRKKNEIYNTG